MPPYLSPHPRGTLLRLKVVPNASRERVLGPLGDALKLSVTVPPEAGKANAAVLKFLARTLGVPSNGLELLRGQTQPRKDVLILGRAPEQVASRLTTAAGGASPED